MYAVQILHRVVALSGDASYASSVARPWTPLPSGYASMSAFGARLDCLHLSGARLVYAGTLCTAPHVSDAPRHEPVGTEAARGTVILAERGGCTFVQKAQNAQILGAKALLVYDPNEVAAGPGDAEAAPPLIMGSDGRAADVRIAAVGLPRVSGEALRSAAADAQHGTADTFVALHLEAWEVGMTAKEASGSDAGFKMLPASLLSRCDTADEGTPSQLQQQQAAASTDLIAELQAEGYRPADRCIPMERTHPVNAAAFSQDEWEHLRSTCSRLEAT